MLPKGHRSGDASALMLSQNIGKELPNPDIWLGANFQSTNPNLLILGESSYDETTPPLHEYIPSWINDEVKDNTFACIYNACTATKKQPYGGASRKAFWDAIAFYNFVPGAIGQESTSRPSAANWRSGIAPLHLVLGALRPKGVLIIGFETSDHARSIVETHRIPYVIAPHTRSGVTTEFLTKSWEILIRITQ